MAPPGGETALEQSDAYPKSAHLSDNRGLNCVAPSGNKRTTNQNAPFQISTNQKLTRNLPIFGASKTPIHYYRRQSCSGTSSHGLSGLRWTDRIPDPWIGRRLPGSRQHDATRAGEGDASQRGRSRLGRPLGTSE